MPKSDPIAFTELMVTTDDYYHIELVSRFECFFFFVFFVSGR